MRTYGKLTVLTGPMFAGKSSGLIKEYLYRHAFACESRGRCPIYYPAIAQRWTQGQVETHSGNGIASMPLSTLPDVPEDTDTLFFDEVQFMEPDAIGGDFVDFVAQCCLFGINVVCAGLNLDYRGRPFRVTADLMAMASDVRLLQATCSECRAPATHTARLDERTDRFAAGDAACYKPMCAEHWQSHILEAEHAADESLG
ncbi:thymidine kinase [Tranquillimonas alkanivorans]|uniref:Thymidine kinase n=1 Tax=Tranquillimonas alkanivorans TaxID=441119 RepID=A0A1I5TKN5_9RHOB|nr:hypothetical protein [Tranquillimonas alkanivorans]SFP83538.1 thymidine kinase [Tranquillimonas alkanivorans]